MPEAMQLELAAPPMWVAGTLKRREEEGDEEEGDEERAKKLARGAKQATGGSKRRTRCRSWWSC